MRVLGLHYFKVSFQFRSLISQTQLIELIEKYGGDRIITATYDLLMKSDIIALGYDFRQEKDHLEHVKYYIDDDSYRTEKEKYSDLEIYWATYYTICRTKVPKIDKKLFEYIEKRAKI